MKSIYLFAGELSGDNHGAALARCIKENHPDWLLRGVGGPAMRHEEVIGTMHTEEFSVMGITDVILNLPQLIKRFVKVRDEIISLKPDAVVFIDYPVFNIKMAQALRKKGYQGKLVHYICPSVWAHSKERIQKMAKTLDMLLTIFPFEPDYFKGTSLKTTYVGNPIAEAIHNYTYDNHWTDKVGLNTDAELIAIFPGSRKEEVARNLPIQLKAARLFQKKHPKVHFAISCAHPDLLDTIAKMAKEMTVVPSHYRYELMRDSTLALATSGTVTLELALHERPTVVSYALTPLNRFIAKYVMKLDLPHYCIVNIISDKAIFPEVIITGANPQMIARELEIFHEQAEARQQCIQGCMGVATTLTRASASDNAVKHLETLVSC